MAYPPSPLLMRAMQASQELSEALSLNPPAAPPGAPPAAPGSPPGPMGAPAPQGPPGAPPEPKGQLGLGPNQNPSPLQATPSFKSPPMEAFLQKAAGRAQQGPVGFALGGRVDFSVHRRS